MGRNRRLVRCGLAVALLVLSPAPEAEAGGLHLEFLLGGALNAVAPLSIEQPDVDRYEIDAEYSTKPFEFPLYYALRVSSVSDRETWELQFIHHKIHLENTTAEVDRFEITDGFNILTLNRAFPAGPHSFRVGAGIVAAHADSRVRGEGAPDRGFLGSGYELAGPALIAGAGKRFPLSDRWTGALEAQVSAASVGVTVAGGRATTTNIAVHLMFGIGYDW